MKVPVQWEGCYPVLLEWEVCPSPFGYYFSSFWNLMTEVSLVLAIVHVMFIVQCVQHNNSLSLLTDEEYHSCNCNYNNL